LTCFWYNEMLSIQFVTFTNTFYLFLFVQIKMQNFTRLCQTKNIVTVNGRFPGPRIIAREGDRIMVKVVNHVQYNVTLHWYSFIQLNPINQFVAINCWMVTFSQHLINFFRHGIRQLKSAWADGPAYITQCPIQTGQSFVYNFTVIGQRGTLWWHAHISWLRTTLYGPIVILPKRHVPYPFPQPFREVPIILGKLRSSKPHNGI